MMNQRQEPPSDESENNINPKVGSGFKGKRQEAARFWARRRHSIGTPKCITTPINTYTKEKYIAVRNKDKSETDFNLSYKLPQKKNKEKIQRQKKS